MALRGCPQLYCLNILKILSLFFLVVIRSDTVNIISKPLLVCELLTASFCVLDICFALYIRGKNLPKASQVIGGVVLNILSILFYHALAVLYGAPLYQSFSETFHLSLVLTAFTTLPCSLVYGIQTFPWMSADLINSGPIQKCIWWSSVCSILGVWIGAFPIPLDWDRPWQEWPVSCVLGACGGQVLGLIIGSMKTLAMKDTNKYKLG